MRTSVDIPEPVYREMKVRAATEGTTIREIILEGVELRLRARSGAPSETARGPRFPAIESRKTGPLKLGEEGIYDYVPFA